MFLFCFCKRNGSLVWDLTTKGRTKREARSVGEGLGSAAQGEKRVVTMLITPGSLEAADVHCTALLGMCTERLRNWCE